MVNKDVYISYDFKDKRQFQSKFSFFHTVHLTPRLSGFPLEFRNGDGFKNESEYPY